MESPSFTGRRARNFAKVCRPDNDPNTTRLADHLCVSEELSEEDQQLKNELEMLVERLKVYNLCSRNQEQPTNHVHPQESDTSLYKPALDAIKNFIKTSTSSMTAVPKPLKFLRPHYDELTEVYDRWLAGTDKVWMRFSQNDLLHGSNDVFRMDLGTCFLCSA